MTDSAVRVPGYSNNAFKYDTDDEDEFDIIEMTPRASSAGTSANSFRDVDSSKTRPPTHTNSLQSVAPLNLSSNTADNDDTSEIATPVPSYSYKANPGPHLARDPSANSEAQTLQSSQSGVFGTSFLSGIAKALGGQGEDPSPISVKDGLVRRRRSGPNEKSLHTTSVPPMRTGLQDGEQQRRMGELLFKDVRDPEAVEFARYMKEDGNVIRTPVLCMCDYGTGNFAADLWILPHNAMRRELFDLYEIMGVIRARYLSLTWGDIYTLRRWWRFFAYFWSQYLVIESELLNPMVDAVLDIDGRCDQIRSKCSPLCDDREWLSLKFEEVNAYMEEFEVLPRSRVLGLICQTTDALGFKMLGLFNGQERLFPPLIEGYHGSSIKLATELQMLEIYRKTNYPEESIVHLMRWMDNGRERDKWLATHLWWGERSTLGRMYKKYKESHGNAVDNFRKKIVRRKQ